MHNRRQIEASHMRCRKKGNDDEILQDLKSFHKMIGKRIGFYSILDPCGDIPTVAVSYKICKSNFQAARVRATNHFSEPRLLF